MVQRKRTDSPRWDILALLVVAAWPVTAHEPPRVLSKQIVVEAPIEAVWRAWTTEEGLRFVSPESRVRLEPGGPYELFLDLEPDERGMRGSEGSRVLDFVYPSMLAFDWTFPPSVPALRRAGAKTRVVVRLRELPGGRVEVRLDADGWQEGPDWEAGWAYFDDGWERVLGRLGEHFAATCPAGVCAEAGAAGGGGSEAVADGELDPAIEEYLEESLRIARENALTRETVDWEALRLEVRRRAAGARRTIEVYPVLRFLLESLDDDHSFLQLSDELAAAESALSGSESAEPDSGGRPPSPYHRQAPEAELLERDGRRIGFVFMPQGRRSNEFATEFQASIAELAARRPCAWIVDLRGNGGGDMWPMLAGLGPLLGDGVVGGSVDATGGRDDWIYRQGRAIIRPAGGEEEVYAEVLAPPVVVEGEPPIAVLIDRGTASSGEAMAVAFRSRPRTRVFGERTYGASTSTRGFKLPDGANLVIAGATFSDSQGRTYPRGVEPDAHVTIGDEALPASEAPDVARAVAWLLEQDECTAATADP